MENDEFNKIEALDNPASSSSAYPTIPAISKDIEQEQPLPSKTELARYFDQLIQDLENGQLTLDKVTDDKRRSHNLNVLHALHYYEEWLAQQLRESGSVLDEAEVIELPAFINDLVAGEGIQEAEINLNRMRLQMHELYDRVLRNPHENTLSDPDFIQFKSESEWPQLQTDWENASRMLSAWRHEGNR